MTSFVGCVSSSESEPPRKRFFTNLSNFEGLFSHSQSGSCFILVSMYFFVTYLSVRNRLTSSLPAFPGGLRNVCGRLASQYELTRLLLRAANASTFPWGQRSRLTDLILAMCVPNSLCWPNLMSEYLKPYPSSGGTRRLRT